MSLSSTGKVVMLGMLTDGQALHAAFNMVTYRHPCVCALHVIQTCAGTVLHSPVHLYTHSGIVNAATGISVSLPTCFTNVLFNLDGDKGLCN